MEGKAKYIHRMFNDLSGHYDKASTAIAFKKDGYWRDFAADLIDGSGELVLDVCCGTGEFSKRIQERSKGRVIGMDFSTGMVNQAHKKYGEREEISFGVADASKLPFKDETFTCVTVSFALRNVENIMNVIKEMKRVLRRNGKIIILDLGKPRSFVYRKMYYFYFYKLAPVIGARIARDGSYAYKYLPHSLTNFPAQEGLKEILDDTGFENIEVIDLSKGITAVHLGIKTSR